MIHVVGYDLKEPNDTADDYARVISAIKEFHWYHIEKSVWLIDTTMTGSEMRDHLKSVLNNNDLLFVGQLNGNWASLNFGKERNDWIKARNF